MKRLLMLGDSLVEYGDWDALLPAYETLNRGMAGETLIELAQRLDGELSASPGQDAVVLQSGTNDLWNNDPCYPAPWHGVLPRLRLLLGDDIPIILCGLAPTGLAAQERIRALNRGLAGIADTVAGCHFLDIYSPLADEKNRPVFMADQVHFAAQGYQIWAKALAALLVKVLPETLPETLHESKAL